MTVVFKVNQRLGVDCLTLGMRLPLSPGSHFGRTTTGVDHRLFQIGLGPSRHVAGHRGAVVDGAEHCFSRRSVMRRIGVQADPAVLGRVVARNRVPHRRNTPAQWANRGGEPEGRQTSIDFKVGEAAGVLLQ